jgi:hypothetical protein
VFLFNKKENPKKKFQKEKKSPPLKHLVGCSRKLVNLHGDDSAVERGLIKLTNTTQKIKKK